MTWTIRALRSRDVSTRCFAVLHAAFRAVLPGKRVGAAVHRAAVGAALLGLAGVNGCPELPDESRASEDPFRRGPSVDIVHVAPDHILVGPADPNPTVAVSLLVDVPSGALDPIAFDVTDAPDDTNRVGLAPLPAAVESFVVEPTAPVPGTIMSFPATLTIRDGAPPGPIYFRVSIHHRESDATGERLVFSYDPGQIFQIHAGPEAPRVGRLLPSKGRRNSTVDVEFTHVTGMEQGITIIPRDSGLEVVPSSVTYDFGTGSLHARIDIHPDAHTGETYFVLQTGLGDRTGRIPFDVEDNAPQPTEILGVYPNPVSPVGVQDLWVAGREFTIGTFLTLAFPVSKTRATLDPSVWEDSRNLSVKLHTQAVGGLVGDDHVTLTAHAFGTQDDAIVAYLGNGSILRSITGVSRSDLVAGVPVQVRIAGVHLDGNVPAVVGLASDYVEAPFADTAVLPGAGAPDFLIAEVKPSLETGPFRLAVSFQNYNTGTLPMRIVDPPASPNPVVTSAVVGRIGRGATLTGEKIRGRGLFDVESVSVEGSRVANVGDVVSNADGTELTVTLEAHADAVLTGDAATNLIVRTRAGRSSNPLSYRVVAPTGGGVDCDSVPDDGVSLTVSGVNGETLHFEQPGPLDIQAIGGFITTIYSVEKHPSGQSKALLQIRMTDPSTLVAGSSHQFNVAVGEIPAVLGPPTYRQRSDATVEVARVSSSPRALALCISGLQLFGTEIWTVNGYEWVKP